MWEEKEAIKVVLKMQELLLSRDLRASDVLVVFAEFDDSGDGASRTALQRLRLDAERLWTLSTPPLPPPASACLRASGTCAAWLRHCSLLPRQASSI